MITHSFRLLALAIAIILCFCCFNIHGAVLPGAFPLGMMESMDPTANMDYLSSSQAYTNQAVGKDSKDVNSANSGVGWGSGSARSLRYHNHEHDQTALREALQRYQFNHAEQQRRQQLQEQQQQQVGQQRMIPEWMSSPAGMERIPSGAIAQEPLLGMPTAQPQLQRQPMQQPMQQPFTQPRSFPFGDRSMFQERLAPRRPLDRDEGEEAAKDRRSWRERCAQRCEERIMEITGQGIESIASDRALVRATVEVRKAVNTTLTGGELQADLLQKLITSVQSDVSERASSVVAFLMQDPNVANSVTKLRTSTVSLEPMYEYKEGRQYLTGYRATNSIAFEIEIPKAGMAIDEIVKRGVTRVDGVSFLASTPVLNQARTAAITTAVEDAMGQATAALDSLSAVSGAPRRELQIIRMDVVGVTRPQPAARMMSMQAFEAEPLMERVTGAAGAYTPVQGEEKTVHATVSMKVRF